MNLLHSSVITGNETRFPQKFFNIFISIQNTGSINTQYFLLKFNVYLV